MSQRSKEGVTVIFPEKGKGQKIKQPPDIFSNNAHAPEFSVGEISDLNANFAELGKQGLGGVLHVIFRKSWTGASLAECIPLSIREEHYQQLHILTHDDLKTIGSVPPHQQYLQGHPDNYVVIGENGSISQSMWRRLTSMMHDRVGIILGGGPGHPADLVYKPILRAIKIPLLSGTPVSGICLGHEMITELLHRQRSVGQGVQGGYYELGSAVEKTTDLGKRHSVFSRFGEVVTVVHVNQYHAEYGQSLDCLNILATNAFGAPSAVEIKLALAGQALSWQAHPEFSMGGEGTGCLTQDRTFAINGYRITIPKGTSIAYAGLVEHFVGSNFDSLHNKYGLTIADVKNLVHPQRMVRRLGERFYGPLLSWMTKFRLDNQSKRN